MCNEYPYSFEHLSYNFLPLFSQKQEKWLKILSGHIWTKNVFSKFWDLPLNFGYNTTLFMHFLEFIPFFASSCQHIAVLNFLAFSDMNWKKKFCAHFFQKIFVYFFSDGLRVIILKFHHPSTKIALSSHNFDIFSKIFKMRPKSEKWP